MIHLTIYIMRGHPGAGKHPSPLEKTKTNSPNHYLTVVFYRIKKYCSYQKLLRFKDCSTRTPVTSCQPPIDRYFGRVHIDRYTYRYRVYRDHVLCVEVFSHIFHPGAGKHPSPLEKTKTNSPNHYLTVVFYRIKKYCSYQKLLRFKDCSTRTPVTSCQPPIDRYFGRVHIRVLASTRALLKKQKPIVLIIT